MKTTILFSIIAAASFALGACKTCDHGKCCGSCGGAAVCCGSAACAK